MDSRDGLCCVYWKKLTEVLQQFLPISLITLLFFSIHVVVVVVEVWYVEMMKMSGRWKLKSAFMKREDKKKSFFHQSPSSRVIIIYWSSVYAKKPKLLMKKKIALIIKKGSLMGVKSKIQVHIYELKCVVFYNTKQ